MGRINIKRLLLLGLVVLGVMSLSAVVHAQTSCSGNYCATETFFGSGGDLNDCSTNYCAKLSAGETGVGNSKGTNYQAQAGFNTTDAPFLEFFVTAANINLGALSTASTATATAQFYVRAYLASGYSVVTASNPPSMGSYNMHTMSSQAASSTGQEQFGINLVANTSPTTFGANPSQYPDSTFGSGYAAAGYNTANMYKYNKGDVIAASNSSSGRTDYTISYIFNISSITPGGTYNFNQDLIAVATY